MTEHIFSPPSGGNYVNGDFVQTTDGVLRLQARRNDNNARLYLSGGDVDIAGTIDVDPLDPNGVRVGDRFYLINTEAPIDFSATVLSHYGGITFEPQLVPGEGLYAFVTAVPEPAHCVAALGVLALVLRRRPRG